MSKEHWRIEKQIEPFRSGKTVADRVKEYENTWIERCYSDGIPDEVPKKLMDSRRAPSWKAVAIAILKNDLNLHSLGFRPKRSKWYEPLKSGMKKPSKQMRLIK
jgi:predicted phosphoadenosine phosphosulfate sulfurtransferase